MTTLLDLLPDLSGTSHKEKHGPCWRCDGKDRFVVFVEKGRAWCRQCGWKGDAIQLLRDRDGLSFVEAKRALGMDTSFVSREAQRKARAHRLALEVARNAFQRWTLHKTITLTDEYRDLVDERETAEVAYRAAHRRLDLYDETERNRWTRRLSEIYDCLAMLEHDLDVLTFRQWEAERFQWWQGEEVQDVRHAA